MGAKKFVWEFQMCRHCRVVDKDRARVQYGYACSVCGKPSEGGLSYFEISIHTLAALIEKASTQLSRFADDTDQSKIHSVAIVIFFCTVREALLNWLIEHLCWAQKVPRLVFERLLADNNVHVKRQNALLPSLTAKKWKALVQQETIASGTDYRGLNDLLERAANARNAFVHEGKSAEIDCSLAAECVEKFSVLLEFYVALHNRYVHPTHLKEVRV
jgi:hypothetical protein